MTPDKLLDKLGIEFVDKTSGGTGRWSICCPFHDDRTPSAAFYEDSHIFHCFTCQLSLPMIQFYKRVHKERGVDLPDEGVMRTLFPNGYRGKPKSNQFLLRKQRLRMEKRLFSTPRTMSRQMFGSLEDKINKISYAYQAGVFTDGDFLNVVNEFLRQVDAAEWSTIS